MTAFEALTNPPASTRPYDESLMTAAVAVVGGKQAASGIRSAALTFAQLTTGSLLNTHTQSHLQPSSLITPRCFASKAGRRCTATCSHSHTQSHTVTVNMPQRSSAFDERFSTVGRGCQAKTYERSCWRMPVRQTSSVRQST